MGSHRCFFGLIVLSAIRAASATCYYPNGTDRNKGFPSDTYYPVNDGDDFSMCCSHLGDKPRSDGLCENEDGTVIWRESCTDQTWQSSKCIKLCAGSSVDTNNSQGEGRQMDNDEQVTPCADGSYCCGDGSLGSTCCNKGRGVFVKDGTTQKDNPSATPTSSTSSPATPSTSLITEAPAGAATNASTAPNSSSKGSSVNPGSIAGGVVGGLAGLLLIIFAVWFGCFRGKKGNKVAQTISTQQRDELPTSPDSMYEGNKSFGPQEVQGSHVEEYKRPELQAGTVSRAAGRAELGAEYSPTPRTVRSS